MARASSAGISTSILLYLIVLWTFVRSSSSSSSSSFVFPKKSAQLCTLLLARPRANQMASGGFAISISGTTNRSEIMESRVLKICMYCTIDYPGICTNHPACSLLAILANRQQWRQFSLRDMRFET